MAVCANSETHPDPDKRYVATVVQGVCFIAFGVVSATALSLVRELPGALMAGVAGLALLPVIFQAFSLSGGGTGHSFVARIALLIEVSSLIILGINSTFWSVVAGVVLARFLQQDKEENSEDYEDK
jgi:benzoate membrane transport protein